MKGSDNTDQDRRLLLGYADDPAARRGEEAAGRDAALAEAGRQRGGRMVHVVGREAQNRVARDLLVFLIASILWVVAIFFLLPWPQELASSSSSSSSSSSAAAAAAAASSSHDAMPPMVVVEGGGGGLNDHGILKDTSRFHNVTSRARLVSCGNSTEEALAGGCRYDTLLNAWVPGRCFDREWVEEYEDDGSWAAFADTSLTEKLALDNMGTREHYYTSVRDHVNHCAMLWRKQFWTLFEDRRVFDSVIVNPYHTEHCAEFLSNLMTMERTEPTLVRVAFAGCWIKDEGEELL